MLCGAPDEEASTVPVLQEDTASRVYYLGWSRYDSIKSSLESHVLIAFQGNGTIMVFVHFYITENSLTGIMFTNNNTLHVYKIL